MKKKASRTAVTKRLLLNDEQCRLLLKEFREFGYPKLTLDEVREAARHVADGTHLTTNVIHVLVESTVDGLTQAIRRTRH